MAGILPEGPKPPPINPETGKPYLPGEIDPRTGKPYEKESKLKKTGEALAEGLKGAAGAIGGAKGEGQMVEPGAPLAKGGLSHVDPEMRARLLQQKLGGRGGVGFKKGGSVKSRDGLAIRGKTKGRFV
jgi:hypothetical protein